MKKFHHVICTKYFFSMNIPLSSIRVLVFIGTRPEVIKMAPIIRRLHACSEVHTTVCTSGQHKEMLLQALADFQISPDENLDVMTAGQNLANLSAVLFQQIDVLLERLQPDWVLIQGDTTTALIAALCAFYRHIRIGHVEAGLRSFNKNSPFPEEINRKAIATVADLHFAPTIAARENLQSEGIAEQNIVVTGNTVVDALLQIRAGLRQQPADLPPELVAVATANRRIILVTSHRRENHGAGLDNVCCALRAVADSRSDVLFVYPVHLNPCVCLPVHKKLAGHPRILLLAPLSYKAILTLMERSAFILTDSGGIQEEASVLHKPVLILRDTTERQEGVKAGAARLVGTNPQYLIRSITELLEDQDCYRRMARAADTLYGDGRAAERIVTALVRAGRTSP